MEGNGFYRGGRTMKDFNGFDKCVIGKEFPTETALNTMRKIDLIKLLHVAENNYESLLEAYENAVNNSKGNSCTLTNDETNYEENAVEELKKYREMVAKFKKTIDDSPTLKGIIEAINEVEKKRKHQSGDK